MMVQRNAPVCEFVIAPLYLNQSICVRFSYLVSLLPFFLSYSALYSLSLTTFCGNEQSSLSLLLLFLLLRRLHVHRHQPPVPLTALPHPRSLAYIPSHPSAPSAATLPTYQVPYRIFREPRSLSAISSAYSLLFGCSLVSIPHPSIHPPTRPHPSSPHLLIWLVLSPSLFAQALLFILTPVLSLSLYSIPILLCFFPCSVVSCALFLLLLHPTALSLQLLLPLL
ncbi:hypothetical protein EX30DRAFT_84634 [Ascodesmis nigricans]|uniref:Uncharacterized protein n=1 Tax=Ascodesmis nigricans TaxID=341454 RepID=A0A4S2N313_9PEZI|nr:hypothetical protein EX30DRAFT_84634 [Ascodesmis nigricans]